MALTMYAYYDHIMFVMATNDQLKKSATGVAKQTAWTASGSVVGGVVGGPAGALVGAVLGAAIGYWSAEDYEATITVLKNLNDEDKQELVKRVQMMVGSTGLDALTDWLKISTNHRIFIEAVRAIISKATQK
ncbi:uncharacterized protein LOC102803710 [Saccoglossus kowalevskii]|uniref:Protein C19orf12 homolog n=1 Tax=Saccoglossus kowalevskii TaxID=10224 RepID=A0ABM0LZG4_SACKO|nr:PREDICTED: protein C19orf12 homolog [Saccoglossus kowalevskii]